MGSLSVSTHRGLFHWQGLVLLVSLLTFWNPRTTAKISIESTYAAEGTDVLLRIRNNPPEALIYVWYKGNNTDNNNIVKFLKKTPNFLASGPEEYERAIVYTNGSLLLKNVTKGDEGVYTLQVLHSGSVIERGSGLLHVREHLRAPVLLSSSYWVIEDEDDVVLTCYTNALSIQWLLNGMNLKSSKRRKLRANGRRVTIHRVKREDAGVYQCVASNPAMRVESQPIELHVLYK